MLERLVVGFYLACGALLFFLSTIIWRENPKGRVNRTTAFMLGFAGLGPIFAAVGQSLPVTAAVGNEPLYRSLQYFWELFFPFLLLFSMEFPARHPLLRRYPRIQWLIFVPHVFHIVLVVGMARGEQIATWLQLSGMGGIPGWFVQQVSQLLRYTNVFFDLVFDFHLKFFSVINLAYVLAGLIFLRQSQKLLTNPRLQTQVRVLAWALRVALGMYALAYIAPILGFVRIPPSLEIALAISALLIGSGGVAYAMIRYQFLDIRLIARQSIVYTATSAVLIGLYVLVIGQVGTWLRAQAAQAAPILDVGFVILAVIFFQPIMSQVEDLIQRFFLRDRTDYRRLMERFSSEIVRIVDFRQLQEKVIATLQEDLLVENAMIAQVVHQPTRIRFYSLARLEEEYSDPEIGELLGALHRVSEPVYFETLSAQAERSRVWAVLAGFKAHILVPLRHGGELAGFLVLSRKLSGYRYSQEDFTVLSVLANQVAIALTNAMLYSESIEKQRLEEELAVARQIQFALLPAKLPESEHFIVDAFAKPARQVGGDFYDFFPTPDGRLGMVIGDASGKGVPAALMIAQLQAVLKTEAKAGGGMARIVRSVNQSVAVGSQNERFATMVYAEFDAECGKLRYCNAGHNYPILIRTDGTHETLETGGLLLGVFEDAEYQEGEIVMQPGDVLLFYTDGLSEVNDVGGREFGDVRLGQAVATHRLYPPQTICQALLQEVLAHATSAAFEDDATAIVLKRRDARR